MNINSFKKSSGNLFSEVDAAIKEVNQSEDVNKRIDRLEAMLSKAIEKID